MNGHKSRTEALGGDGSSNSRRGELTVCEYCDAHDLSESSFYTWRKKLKSIDQRGEATPNPEDAAGAAGLPVGPFFSVRLPATHRRTCWKSYIRAAARFGCRPIFSRKSCATSWPCLTARRSSGAANHRFRSHLPCQRAGRHAQELRRPGRVDRIGAAARFRPAVIASCLSTGAAIG